jgi:hypothetical protein
MVDANSFQPPAECRSLYRHFLETGRIRPVPPGDEGLMRYTGRDIRRMIESGDATWQRYVPEVAHRSALHAGHDPARAAVP